MGTLAAVLELPAKSAFFQGFSRWDSSYPIGGLGRS